MDLDPSHTHGLPRQAGRDAVSLRDRMLVEWVAKASVGDGFPEPYCWARDPLQSIVLSLRRLGVIEMPAPGTDWAEVAAIATAGARAWLERNPIGGAPAGAEPISQRRGTKPAQPPGKPDPSD